MSVPPLDVRVVEPGVDGVGLHPRHRHLEAVEDVQQRDREDRRDPEPDRDVHRFFLATCQGAEEVHRVDDPDHGDRDVDRPLEFGVLLRGRLAEHQAHGGRDDDRVPAPEIDARERVGEHPHAAQPLDAVVAAGEHGAEREAEDHGVGVERADPPETQIWRKVQRRKRELQRGEQSDAHPDDAPDERGDRKAAHDRHVIVATRRRDAGHERPLR